MNKSYKDIFDTILPGTNFGYWQTLDNILVLKKGKLSISCLCLKCFSTETYVSCQSLISGKSTKCKTCQLKDIDNNKEFYETYKGIIGNVFSRIKQGAKERNIEFNITIEYLGDLFEAQEQKCALSGLELKLKQNYLDNTSTASLDRKDSFQGYIIGNVQWVHKDINYMKQQFEENYFISLCEKVVNNSILKSK